MRTDNLQNVLGHLRLEDGGLTDAQLLTHFLDGREEAATEFLDLLRTEYRVSEQGLGFRMFEKGHVLPPWIATLLLSYS